MRSIPTHCCADSRSVCSCKDDFSYGFLPPQPEGGRLDCVSTSSITSHQIVSPCREAGATPTRCTRSAAACWRRPKPSASAWKAPASRACLSAREQHRDAVKPSLLPGTIMNSSTTCQLQHGLHGVPSMLGERICHVPQVCRALEASKNLDFQPCFSDKIVLKP